jgi:signal transduction histidine kinase
VYAVQNLKMAELVTRSGFDQDIEIRSVNVVTYVREYLDIYTAVFSDSEILFEVNAHEITFVRDISVLNLSIVLDNLISNAEKWGAKLVKIDFRENKDKLEIFVSDNGAGLSELFIDNPESVFKLGARDIPKGDFEGSGIGLYYSKSLMNDMKGDIFFVGNNIKLSGATFKVVIG